MIILREIDRKKMKHTMRCLKNALFLTGRVTAVCGKQTEIGTVVFRTAIEAEKRGLLKRDMPDARSEKKLIAAYL